MRAKTDWEILITISREAAFSPMHGFLRKLADQHVMDVLLRLSHLIEAILDMLELDEKPIFTLPKGQCCKILERVSDSTQRMTRPISP